MVQAIEASTAHSSRLQWQGWIQDHWQTLFRQACAIVGNTADAEDVIQTLLQRLWQNRDSLEHVSSMERYLISAARNEAKNFLRSKRNGRRVTSLEDLAGYDPVSLASDPLVVLTAAELQQHLQACCHHLSPTQRTLFSLLKEDPQLSGRAAATLLGCSHKNIQHLLKRIRAIISPALSAYCKDGSAISQEVLRDQPIEKI